MRKIKKRGKYYQLEFYWFDKSRKRINFKTHEEARMLFDILYGQNDTLLNVIMMLSDIAYSKTWENSIVIENEKIIIDIKLFLSEIAKFQIFKARMDAIETCREFKKWRKNNESNS